MPLKLIKRGDIYHVTGTVRGRSIRRSTKTGDRDAAEALRIKWEAEALQRSVFGAKATATFSEAASGYMKAGGERRFLAPIILELGKEKLANIRQKTLDDAAERLYSEASNATKIRQFYTPAIAVMNYAAANELCEWRKFKKPKAEKKAVSIPNDNWWDKVLPQCKPNLAALLIFLSYTGARISEALRLEWEDVDMERKTAILRRTKNGEPREVDLVSPVFTALTVLETTGRVFGYETPSGARATLRRACKRAGVKFHGFHAAGRHTLARRLLSAGKSLQVVKQAGGWKTIQMVSDRYGHMERKDVKDALEGVARKRTPKVRKVE